MDVKIIGQFTVKNKIYYIRELTVEQYYDITKLIDDSKSQTNSKMTFFYYLNIIVIAVANVTLEEIKNWPVHIAFSVIELLLNIYMGKTDIEEDKIKSFDFKLMTNNEYTRKIIIN